MTFLWTLYGFILKDFYIQVRVHYLDTGECACGYLSTYL